MCDSWYVRFRSADGEWVIDVIHLSLTGNNRDGERYRIRHLGWFIAELRTIAELRKYVDLARLEEVLAWRMLRLLRHVSAMKHHRAC